MKKIRTFLIISGSLVLLLTAIVIPAQKWLLKTLAHGIAFGDYQVQFFGPRLKGMLGFETDSLTCNFPQGHFSSQHIQGHIKTFRSLIDFKPNLEIHLEKAYCQLLPDKKTQQEKKDFVFSDFNLPFPFQLQIDQLHIQQESMGLIVIKDFSLHSINLKKISLEIAAVQMFGNAAWPKDFAPAFNSTLGWRDSLRLSVNCLWHADRIELKSVHHKKNLLKGYDSLKILVDTLPAYASKQLALPAFSKLNLAVKITWFPYGLIKGTLDIVTPHIGVLENQKLNVKFTLAQKGAKLDLKSRGIENGEMHLNANIHWPKLGLSFGDSSFSILAWMKAWKGELQWASENVPILLGHDVLPGDAESHNLVLGQNLNVTGDFVTRDGSELRLEINPIPFKLSFAGKISADEEWAKHWTDTNVSFQKAYVKGYFTEGVTHVMAQLSDVHAYLAAVDSARVYQHINVHGYYVDSANLFWNKNAWAVLGQVEWPWNEKLHEVEANLFFDVKHPTLGHAYYHMPTMHSMEAKADQVAFSEWPYVPLHFLSPYKPLATAHFNWDWKHKLGEAGGFVEAVFQNEIFQTKLQGDWNATQFNLSNLDIGHDNSNLHSSMQVALHGRQFYEMGHSQIVDLHFAEMEAKNFDIAKISNVFLQGKPLETGHVAGRLTFTDSLGFLGNYQVSNLKWRHSVGDWNIPSMTLQGEEKKIKLNVITQAPKQNWWNDTLNLTLIDLLQKNPSLILKIKNREGWQLEFLGVAPELRSIEGDLKVFGDCLLPSEAGKISNFNFASKIKIPLRPFSMQAMTAESYRFQGLYTTLGIDTLHFNSTLQLQNGLLQIPQFVTQNKTGESIVASLNYTLAQGKKLQIDMQSESFGLQYKSRDKLRLKEFSAALIFDTLGMNLKGKFAQGNFSSERPPIKFHADLQNVDITYLQPNLSGNPQLNKIPALQVHGKFSGLLFQHKIGFREIQSFFKSLKNEQKKKKVKPLEIQIALEARGTENRIQTDILRMNFTGDINVRGTYPYTLVAGQFSALNGELGQINQSYPIRDFDLKWQNTSLEEGLVSMEGERKLLENCHPNTQKTCLVNIHLLGLLSDMKFSYESTCGQGEVVEIPTLINSVNRGCYIADNGAGANSNYGQAAASFLEPAINQTLTGVVDKASSHWIANTTVSGLSSVVAKDKDSSQAIAIEVESKEKFRLTAKLRGGYLPEKKNQNPLEYLGAVAWRPPISRVIKDSTLAKKMEERLRLEASIESRKEDRFNESDNRLQKQIGLRYRYKFWKLW